jgi:endonuclease/exonuclease/phosphatase family metal-dependent hydrolase
VGDFNAYARDNRAYDLLVAEGGLTDTWYAAKERRNETANTFQGFGELEHEGRRIDWILARGGVRTGATEVVTFRQGRQWPSDHLPVAAWVTLS